MCCLKHCCTFSGQALTAIHEAKYLHGDVRRENLIFEEGTGKVRMPAYGV